MRSLGFKFVWSVQNILGRIRNGYQQTKYLHRGYRQVLQHPQTGGNCWKITVTGGILNSDATSVWELWAS